MTSTASGIMPLSPTVSPGSTALTRASLDSNVTSLVSVTGSPVSSTTSSTSSTFSNLFPMPTEASPPTRRGISQTVLMWIFAVIAVGLLSSIMAWRYTCSKFKRRRRQARTPEEGGDNGRIWPGFPGLGAGSGSGLESPSILRTSGAPLGSQHGRRQSHPIILSTSFLSTGLVPVVHRDGTLVHETRPYHHRHHSHQHHHHQRVRGADVDEGGRRRGGGGGSDGGGSIALEELPAYHEAGKSPPGYQAVAFLPNYLPVGGNSEGGGGGGGGVSVPQSQNQDAQPQSQNQSSSPNSDQGQGQSQSPNQSPSPSQPPPVPYSSRPNIEDDNENPIPD